VVATAAFMGITGTAHAGYAYTDPLVNNFNAYFYAGPGEAPDLSFQVLDGGTGVVFEDRTNPMRVGPPPVDEFDLNDGDLTYPEEREPCELISEHKALCTDPNGFDLWRMYINSGDLPAKVHDVAGDQRWVDIVSGPLNDEIVIEHQIAAFLVDGGGANRIRVGDGSGLMSDYDNYVTVGPGASEIDVRNGSVDRISCFSYPGLATPGSMLANPLDTVFADPNDSVSGCGTVER
jgi:hypothetical protein